MSHTPDFENSFQIPYFVSGPRLFAEPTTCFLGAYVTFSISQDITTH